MRVSSLKLGSSRLLAEITSHANAEIGTDEYGFIRPSPTFFTYERLLARRCSLVVAPPWTGKTYLARRIEASLHDTGRFVHRTDFEAWLPGDRIEPPGWDRWLAQNEEELVWLIDALDEAQRKQKGIWPSLRERLQSMPHDARTRLRLLILAREGDIREVASSLERDLQATFGEQYFKAQLLPLDRANAEELFTEKGIGHQDRQRVLNAITSNRLQAVAGLPAALLHLAKSKRSVDVSERDVWRGILEEILEEHGEYRTRFQTQPEERFEAATRIAAVLTLSGNDAVHSKPSDDEPSISQIFTVSRPFDPTPSRAAAYEALRSGMFREGRRFLHKNVREWMTAFELSSLPLEKLRPILQKKPGSSETPASIRAEFYDLADLLVKVHDSPEVQEWIRRSLALFPLRDLFTRSLADVLPLLDRLEELSARGGRPDWLDEPDSLQPLAVPGLGNELTRRIRDASKPPWTRILFLRLGTELRLDEVLRAAASIVSDTSDDPDLRSWSASALRRAERVDLLRSVEDFVETSLPVTREERETVSTLIAALVEAGLWRTARAFRATPPGLASDIIDSTRVLPHVLEEHMTLDDAEAIIRQVSPQEMIVLSETTEEDHRLADRQRHPRWEVIASAARKLALAEPLDPNRLHLLIPFIISIQHRTAYHEFELMNALKAAFRASPAARRKLFDAIVESARQHDGAGTSIWLYQLLTPDDLGWLEERLAVYGNELPELFTVALGLAYSLAERAVRQRVRKIVRERAPTALARFDQFRARERAQKRRTEKEKVQEENRKRRIDEIDREILTLKIPMKQRMHQLSWVNFSSASFRPRNLVGDWSDVPDDLQRTVLDCIAAALDEVEPTPVPEGQSFPTNLLYEAQAFLAVLRLHSEAFPLTSVRIGRWLPAVLRAISDDKKSVLEQCAEADRAAFEDAVIESIARELRLDSSYSVVLQDLPASLWTNRITEWVIDAIEGRQPEPARPSLLELLASRRPDQARAVARRILTAIPLEEILRIDPGSGLFFAEVQPLGMRSLDVLVSLDPEFVWPAIKEGVQKAGKPFVTELRSLGRNARAGLQANWQTWPAERLGELAAMLVTIFPLDQEPDDDEGWVTPAHDLQSLRWQILEHLAALRTSEANSAIELIRQVHPKAREIADRLIASRQASELRPAAALQAGGIRVTDVCRLLDEKYFRLIRGDNDLLEVVVEVLRRMEVDVGNDIALFYQRSKGVPRRQSEEALQVYVRRRLADLLPGKVLDRETQVKWGRRYDIRVMAPVIGEGEQAKVVVEIKWSDNSGLKRGVSTGLTQQLGDEYLLQERLTSGVFLVGWNGKLGTWRADSPRPESNVRSLAAALDRQAEEFAERSPGHAIRAVVWNLEWRRDHRRKMNA